MSSCYPTAAINCADKCWFCVPFVFQGVSNFCSDVLFKLQAPVVQTLDSAIQRLNNWGLNINVEGGYYCGATRAIASTI